MFDHPRVYALEGADCCGKTTQLSALQSFLQDKGHRVRTYRDPGDTPAGERMRTILKDASLELCPYSQLLLFSAARMELAREVLRAHRESPVDIVLLDRWALSTWIYQVLINQDLPEVHSMYSVFWEVWNTLPLRPTQFLVLQISEAELLRRMQARDDKVRFETPEFQSKVCAHFRTLEYCLPAPLWTLVTTFDTSDNSVEQVTEMLAGHILDA